MSDFFTYTITQVTNASAYDAGDSVGGKITITNAVGDKGGFTTLKSIHVIDKGNQKAVLEILFFNSDPAAATITDDVAFVYSTDINKQIGRVSIAAADYVTLNSLATANLGSINKVLAASSESNSLYAVIVTTGTPTYISTGDIVVTFSFERE